MSSFGLFMILFVALLVLIAFIRFLAWLTELQEAHGSVPRAVLHGVQYFISVKPFQDVAPLMSRETARTEQTDQTDQTDQGSSEADLWMDRIAVDKTKTTLIELLVYSDWDVREIRSVIKGDNAVLGAEIEQARKQLGISTETRVTPIAHRPTEASYPA